MKVNLVALIGVIFIVLKLAEVGVVASWSWWLVLLPFWIGFAILGAVLVSSFVCVSIVFMATYIKTKLKR